MNEYTVEHKFSGTTKTINGNDLWSAMRKNNLEEKYWIEKK